MLIRKTANNTMTQKKMLFPTPFVGVRCCKVSMFARKNTILGSKHTCLAVRFVILMKNCQFYKIRSPSGDTRCYSSISLFPIVVKHPSVTSWSLPMKIKYPAKKNWPNELVLQLQSWIGPPEKNEYIYICGYGSKLSTPIVGWWILKIDLNLWSPRSYILTHTHVWVRHIFHWLCNILLSGDDCMDSHFLDGDPTKLISRATNTFRAHCSGGGQRPWRETGDVLVMAISWLL